MSILLNRGGTVINASFTLFNNLRARARVCERKREKFYLSVKVYIRNIEEFKIPIRN